ncbi:unnamed protein product [Prunus armeniaca]|uniref:Uncharacterized protein n=1 Tax=Prunus armeniaca TaxID=36596 RepID=A0A6J5WC15_PRUAR|nr:unnamed protein product [Prunus armeniaca]CAB4299266.1 unnamed protein product [Prunus armeniaca]
MTCKWLFQWDAPMYATGELNDLIGKSGHALSNYRIGKSGHALSQLYRKLLKAFCLGQRRQIKLWRTWLRSRCRKRSKSNNRFFTCFICLIIMKHHLVDRWQKLFKLIRRINSHLRRHGKPSDQRPKRQGMSFVVVYTKMNSQ